jgi:hypothetical protein
VSKEPEQGVSNAINEIAKLLEVLLKVWIIRVCRVELTIFHLQMLSANDAFV